MLEEYNHNIDQIGIGATFPIQLSTNDRGQRGWYPVEGDVDLIKNNLQSLIEYTIGQRFREEEFGTRLWECIEEPNIGALSFMVKEFLKQAVYKYENRVKIKRITTERESTNIRIIMEYDLVGLDSNSYMVINYNLS